MMMHPGMGGKLLGTVIVMILGYYVLVTAEKQQKGLKTLGQVIGVCTIIGTALMIAVGAVQAYKWKKMCKSNNCPMAMQMQMQKPTVK